MKIFSKVIIPASAAKTGGSLKDWVWDQLVQGHRVVFEDGNVVLNGLDANVQPIFSELVSIVQAGGTFEGVKVRGLLLVREESVRRLFDGAVLWKPGNGRGAAKPKGGGR